MWTVKLILFFMGAVLFCNGLFALFITKPNMGSVLPIVLSLPMLICAVLFEMLTAYALTRVLMYLGAAAYVMFFAFIVSLSVFLHKFGSRQNCKTAKVLIVLGMGLKGEKMLPTLKLRLDGAADYLKANPNCRAILSGGLVKAARRTEAEAMQEYLVGLGIDSERITLEDESKSTYENFMFSRRILNEMSVNEQECLFITNNFHVFRSQKTAQSLGLNIQGTGTRDAWYIASNNYLRECAAIVQYVIKGKIKI